MGLPTVCLTLFHRNNKTSLRVQRASKEGGRGKSGGKGSRGSKGLKELRGVVAELLKLAFGTEVTKWTGVMLAEMGGDEEGEVEQEELELVEEGGEEEEEGSSLGEGELQRLGDELLPVAFPEVVNNQTGAVLINVAEQGSSSDRILFRVLSDRDWRCPRPGSLNIKLFHY